MTRWLALGLVTLASAVLAAPAGAEPAPTAPGVLAGQTVSGNPIPCTTQSDGVRVCHGTDASGPLGSDVRLRSFDGAPLEVYVILPPAPSGGGFQPFPLVIQSHGWGQSAGGPDSTEYMGPTADSWAQDGYAVLQLTARGFGDSCGRATPPAARGPCQAAPSYIHLDDARFEARDVQYAAGLLVDEGWINPAAIGATGPSYGGGLSLELATLEDRTMNENGSLSPWTSPAGTPLRIAAAAPVIPWSDLVASLLPNGRTRDDRVVPPSADLAPLGVEKQSFVSALFGLGAATGTYSTTDPEADLPEWFAAISAGEPYEKNPLTPTIIAQMARYRSPYYLLDGAYGTGREAPAPLLIASGFTDDLFPVDEAVRYYNLVRALYPGAAVGLLDGDFGHQRAQNKAADEALLSARIQGLFDHYLKGASAWPGLGTVAFTETCPSSAPSGGPFSAPSWSALHPGQVAYSSPAGQVIDSGAGNPAISAAVDPVAGAGACATVRATDQGTGVATYRLPAATSEGYTLLGSPTITANLAVAGQYALIAARLWDLDPSHNTETLVARGVYRVDPAGPDGVQSFQLHPGAWHFAAGHVAKLELLGQDSPYVRRSNGTFQIQVSDLQLVLPVHEAPGSPGTPATVQRFGTPLPRVCSALPVSNVTGERVLSSRHELILSGSAGEHPCASTPASVRRHERVSTVTLTIYQRASHGRCRFLKTGGRLSPDRACTRPLELRARGTGRWRLVVRGRLAPGRYLITVEATDGLHRYQLRPTTAALRVP